MVQISNDTSDCVTSVCNNAFDRLPPTGQVISHIVRHNVSGLSLVVRRQWSEESRVCVYGGCFI